MQQIMQFVGIAVLVDIAFAGLIIMYGSWLASRPKSSQQPVKLAGMWHTVDVGSERHHLPVVDTIEHEVVRCACSPKRVPGKVQDNPDVFWQVTHQSIDGRTV